MAASRAITRRITQINFALGDIVKIIRHCYSPTRPPHAILSGGGAVAGDNIAKCRIIWVARWAGETISHRGGKSNARLIPTKSARGREQGFDTSLEQYLKGRLNFE